MKRLVGAVTVGFVLASGGTASAWWAEGSAIGPEPVGIVWVYGDPGEASDLVARNRLTLPGVAWPGGGVTLHDPTNPVTSVGRGCEQLDANTLRCHGVSSFPGPGTVVYLAMILDDGDDRLRIPVTSDYLYLLGSTGTGNDVISSNARSGGGAITLGDGDDRITLRGGEGELNPGDDVDAGAGDDVLSLVNLADDNPICGAGVDRLYADVGETSADCETVVGVP